MDKFFAAAEAATLEQVLDSRELRAATQRRLIKKYGTPLLCLTLNMPGPYKAFPLAKHTYEVGIETLKDRLSTAGNKIVHFETQDGVAGYCAFFACQGNAAGLKALTVEIEDNHPLGRLFDIDVLDRDMRKLSREGEPRRCLICDRAAAECGRGRVHPLDEVVGAAVKLMRDYFSAEAGRQASKAAVKALLNEVAVTPKPGLVDRRNSGSHRDMDFFSFISSATALAPYFGECVKLGYAHEGDAPQLFAKLRKCGIEAERAMLAATNGVNVHKGAIFSLGLVCGAYGYLVGVEAELQLDSILDYVANMTSRVLDDFIGLTKENATTYGQRLYLEYGISGVRGEAAQGFPVVRDIALPALQVALKDGASLNDAGVLTLMHLLANTDDTNILHRSDIKTLAEMRQRAAELLHLYHDEGMAALLAAVQALDDEFIRLNISAGGCADLLALTFLLNELIAE